MKNLHHSISIHFIVLHRQAFTVDIEKRIESILKWKLRIDEMQKLF